MCCSFWWIFHFVDLCKDQYEADYDYQKINNELQVFYMEKCFVFLSKDETEKSFRCDDVIRNGTNYIGGSFVNFVFKVLL